MASGAMNAPELARRLVTRAASTSDGPDGVPLAVQTACENTCRELTRQLGQTGSLTLLSRSMSQAQSEHPLLAGIQIGHNSDLALNGVAEAIEAHGRPAVAAALEATLERLLTLLGRLIGDDMVERLVESSATSGTQDHKGGK